MANDFLDLGKFMEEEADDIIEGVTRRVHAVALSIDQNVVISTPVDTGRARGNWIAEVGHDPTQAEPDTKSKDGAASIKRAAEAIEKFDARRHEEIYIANNLPYIEKLDAGSSAQAPANFVEQAISIGIQQVDSGEFK